MNNLVDRIYVHAKISALHGYLLSKDDYLQITRSGKIHVAFPDILTERDSSDIIHAKEIIFRKQIKTFILFIALNDYYKELFKAFLSLFEIINIKQILLKAYGRSELIPQWYDVAPYNILDASFRSRDVQLDDLPTLFAGTIFSEALSSDEFPSYEEVEKRIDFLALKNMLRFSPKLTPDDEMIFNDILMRKMVSMKIIWGSRSAQRHENDFPQFDPMDIFEGISEAGEKIQSIEKEIGKSIRSSSSDAGTDDIPRLENFLHQLFLCHVKKIFSGNFHGICPVISYAWSAYYQIRNLFTIIEGFHFRVNPDIIMQHIITGA